MAKKIKTFTSLWFIIGLGILLLNDFLLKSLYPNWLTGKLSDFAGLFVFVLFWVAFFPKQKTAVFILTIVFFTYFKSSFSESMIEIWNGFGFGNIYRVVDYTDLIAFAILPFAYLYEKNIEHSKNFKFNPIYAIFASCIAFMATSFRTDLDIQQDYYLNYSKDSLAVRMKAMKDWKTGSEAGYGVDFTHKVSDTLYFSLPSDFCFNDFDVIVGVTAIQKQKTKINLISACHRCPKGLNDKIVLSKEFEQQIIDRLQ
jgi:hypothetical protein